jgi:hypothetical protein
MWRLWRFRPRPLLQPWKWNWRYYAWRFETYTGKPATEITYRSFLDFLQDADLRRALRRYLRWLAHMSKLPRF